MNNLLDKFTIAVRRCRHLDPDGYEVVLELRRATASTESNQEPVASAGTPSASFGGSEGVRSVG